MFRAILPAALSAAVLLAAPPAGAQETRTLDLPPFDRVAIASGIAAVVTVGGAQSVTVETENAELMRRLRVDVRAGELRAEIDYNWLDTLLSGGFLSGIFGDRPAILISISAPTLVGATADSGSRVEIDTMSGEDLALEAASGSALIVAALDGGRVVAEASSGASLTIQAGACERLDADSSSGANLDMASVQCGEVLADASSGASATVFARDAIDADASSGASVHVLGAPARSRVNSSSGGSVRID